MPYKINKLKSPSLVAKNIIVLIVTELISSIWYRKEKYSLVVTADSLKEITGTFPKPWTIGAGRGLSVMVSRKGKISFVYRFRWKNKPQRMKIGGYPQISLAKAHRRVTVLRRLVYEGLDPRMHVPERLKDLTLDLLFQEYLEDYVNAQLKETTYNNYKSKYNAWVKTHETINVITYSHKEWVAYFDGIAQKSTLENTGAVLKIVKSIVRRAMQRGQISGSKVLDIPLAAVAKHTRPRQRVLEWEELAELWNGVHQSNATLQVKSCIFLLIQTGGRNTEIRESKRSEFNLDKGIWILPPERSKSKRAIKRALSTQVITYLKSLDVQYGAERIYLLPTKRDNTPCSTQAITKLVSQVVENLGVRKFVPHDFRRTLITRLSELGVLPHVTEKMLGHELTGVMAIYNKHDWINEQRKAYELFSTHLEIALKKRA